MKILIATNHSYMFYRFRKELVEALMQEHEVILSTPFVGHEDDLQAMGLRCIETAMAGLINVYDILKAKYLVLDKEALAVIQEVSGGSRRRMVSRASPWDTSTVRIS